MYSSEYYGKLSFKDGTSTEGLKIKEIREYEISEDIVYRVHFYYLGHLIECTRFWDGDEKFEDLGPIAYTDVVLEMQHLDLYKKKEDKDMKCPIKVGDFVRLKPFHEVCDADDKSAYGIAKSQYKKLSKGIITVRNVRSKESPGSDPQYDFTFDVLSNEGVTYVIPDIFIDGIFPNDSESDDIKYAESDNVKHPNHYNQGGMEVWDVIKAFTSNLSGAEAFYAGNAIKYILRWDKKNGIEDLEKAKVYIDMIIKGRKNEE